ncbi:MAG: Uma2 family endonuclease, partial [Cyanobacteria bacterium J06636_28]
TLPGYRWETSPQPSSQEALEAKILEFLLLGTQVGLLIDPETRTIAVYRAGQPTVVLDNEDRLTVPDVLPGWEVSVADLWPLVFE